MKIKRILAMIGVVLLVALYASTLVFALMKSPNSAMLFKASVMATIAVPIFIYGYMIIYRVLKGRGLPPDNSEDKSDNKYL